MGARARVKSACPGYADRENEGFLSALFCPRYVGQSSDSLIQTSHVRGPDILLVSCIHGNVPFRSTISTCRALSPLRNVVFRYMLRSFYPRRGVTLRGVCVYKRFIRSREVRIVSAQPGFINKRIDRLAEKRMVCGWSR